MWKELTGLPFVFAVWAVRKKFADDFPNVVQTVAKLFCFSRQKGEKNIDIIAARSARHLGFSTDFCSRYYSCLGYNLNGPEKKGLNVFLYTMFRKKMLPEKVRLSFI
jgi:chorismate dehydratase